MDYRDNKEFYQSRELLRNSPNYNSERYQNTTNIKGGIVASFFAALAFASIVFMVNVLAGVVAPLEKPALNLPELPNPISSPSYTN